MLGYDWFRTLRHCLSFFSAVEFLGLFYPWASFSIQISVAHFYHRFVCVFLCVCMWCMICTIVFNHFLSGIFFFIHRAPYRISPPSQFFFAVLHQRQWLNSDAFSYIHYGKWKENGEINRKKGWRGERGGAVESRTTRTTAAAAIATNNHLAEQRDWCAVVYSLCIIRSIEERLYIYHSSSSFDSFAGE